MRLFAGGIATETNTFSPIPTGLADFDVVRDSDLVGGEVVEGFGKLFNPVRSLVEAQGGEFIFGLFAFAQPAGVTTRPAYESLRAELLAKLQAALPVEAVFLFLHGAMVAEGYDDCETDILARVRQIVGPEVKVGVELDLHCSVTPAMLEAADAIILYKEYPHIDMADRAVELFELLAAAVEGKISPTMALFDCRMIGLYLTPHEPMRSFVREMQALEGREGILSVSLAHSFPWGDVEPCTAQVLTITDGDPGKAQEVAETLGRKFFAMRRQLDLKSLPLEAALDKALAIKKGPVVIADQSDNAGGGAPSDATFALKALLERGVENVAIGMFWDPIAVQLAMAAGVGARLELRLGGKIGPVSGNPLDLSVTVTGIVKDLIQEWPQQSGGAIRIDCGDTVALHCQGIDIIANSKRSQVFGTEVFSQFGIEPAQRRLLVVKSTQHFYAAYAPIASEVIYMAAPGAVAPLFKEIPYRRVRLDKYPWVD